MIKNEILNKLKEKNWMDLLEKITIKTSLIEEFDGYDRNNEPLYKNLETEASLIEADCMAEANFGDILIESGIEYGIKNKYESLESFLKKYCSTENKDIINDKNRYSYSISCILDNNNEKKEYYLVSEDYPFIPIKMSTVIKEVTDYLKSEMFDKDVEEMKNKHSLYVDYRHKELWRKLGKDYKDNEYVSILRMQGDNKLYYNDLYDYLKEKHISDIYKIFNLREEVDAMYISKSKLKEILKDELPEKIAKDIKKVIKKEVDCCFCNSTSYVNTEPYVYDDCGGCVGRLYACPVCLDLYDLRITPDSDYKKKLNGDERIELMSYIYDKIDMFK